jgi:hypothetical protein
MDNHNKTHENDEGKLKGKHFICDLCGTLKTELKIIKRHMEVVHLDTEQIECKHCKKFYKGKQGLSKHLMRSDCKKFKIVN